MLETVQMRQVQCVRPVCLGEGRAAVFSVSVPCSREASGLLCLCLGRTARRGPWRAYAFCSPWTMRRGSRASEVLDGAPCSTQHVTPVRRLSAPAVLGFIQPLMISDHVERRAGSGGDGEQSSLWGSGDPRWLYSLSTASALPCRWGAVKAACSSCAF